MAVVGYKRVLDGTSVAGKYGESLQISEKWLVRTDSPQTSKPDILNIVATGGVHWGAAHWEFPACKAMEFSCSPTGKDGMLWTIDVKYYIPPLGKQVKENGLPEDIWEMTGSVTTVPVFTDTNDDTICNSAGDPLEGLEKEQPATGYVLTKFYDDDSWEDAFFECAGTINSTAWAGGDAKTWKCDFKGATPRSISRFDGEDDGAKINFVETKWEFRYEPLTWKCMPWDIGFMELVDGKRQVIKDDKGNTVKQPVALNSNGTKKSPGEKPVVINNGAGVDIYETADFSSYFGTPHLLPTT